MLPILGKPVLELMIERIKRVPSIDAIIIATTSNATDDCLKELAERLGVFCFRGSEEDVMGRVLGAAQAYDVDVIVELTGDCPMIDPMVVEECIVAYHRSGVDYVSNRLERTYSIGMDTQVFSTSALADAANRTQAPNDREHVSAYFYAYDHNLYTLKNVAAPPELTDPELAITLDTPEDYDLIKTIFELLYPQNPEFTLADILDLTVQEPRLREINRRIKRTWDRADA